ncbi:hypothetical protein D6S11_26670 [Salmonella enterica subsp. enterica]|nr:hypothetical protein [Salmonella enterica subsp. enterica serovar Isaszeg]
MGSCAAPSAKVASKFTTSRFLQQCPQGLPYLSLFTPGAIRYDLSGRPAGSVTEREILHARQACERILRFQQQKAEKAQQKNAIPGDCDEKND